MASKEKRGLPPGYDLHIPDPESSKPVQLGDYLEEVDAETPRAAKACPPPTSWRDQDHRDASALRGAR